MVTKRTHLSMSEICWRSGEPIGSEQGGMKKEQLRTPNLICDHLLTGFPGTNSKEFLIIILSKAEEEQSLLFESEGRVWRLSGASLRMVKKSFQ